MLLRVKIVVGHPRHVGMVGGEVAPVGAVTDYGVVMRKQRVQAWRNPLGQIDAIGVGRRGQRDDRQVRPVVLEELGRDQPAEGDADEHGAGGESFDGGKHTGEVFVRRGGREIEKGDLGRLIQNGQQGVSEQPDGAVGGPAFAVEKRDVVCHRFRRASPF